MVGFAVRIDTVLTTLTHLTWTTTTGSLVSCSVSKRQIRQSAIIATSSNEASRCMPEVDVHRM